MYKEHYSFHSPSNDITIWRYLDFTKFVDLILTSQLHFTRSDKFDDPFEGDLKFKDFDVYKCMFANQAITKKYYFLNCWHINEDQSDAMWKIFLNTKNGIAIKSTIGNLIECLDKSNDDVYISQVYYCDFNKITFDELIEEERKRMKQSFGEGINLFKYKRISFEHEKELRLMFIDLPIPHVTRDCPERLHLDFKRIDINLNSLINEIVIAPFADVWFKTLVEKFVLNFNLDFIISKSDLYTKK
jgi:hypothetical protein